ncbi:hypothetical protein YIM_38930 [Amycolatopsis sp. YIM 10]|nr:hypothetical protein YIM_38930 [Amycolatopsis sp. YIM 10]
METLDDNNFGAPVGVTRMRATIRHQAESRGGRQ